MPTPAGDHPFEAKNMKQLVKVILHGSYDPLPTIYSPGVLDNVSRRCNQKGIGQQLREGDWFALCDCLVCSAKTNHQSYPK